MDTGGLGVADVKPAVVTIDLHRGHLDDVATLPLDRATAQRVVEANVGFLREARLRGVPVVHVVTEYRTRDEIASNPFWRAISGTNVTRGNMMSHNLSGSPGTELMPGIRSEADVVVGGKRRYDCFNATDLEFTLRNLGVNTLLITGVNTNSCVLATTIVASTKDFGCVVISDCVDTV
ncbi:MAG TPA: isochorismatase family cysteine hydrolase, partial [Actinomycetota bacterium]|nr:isochorismatase family cysteine hydrolase [Actinomycetota bacterium]